MSSSPPPPSSSSLVDCKGSLEEPELGCTEQIAEEMDEAGCAMIVRRVKRDLGLLARQWDCCEVEQKYDPRTQTFVTVKTAKKRKRDAEWHDASQLVRCAVPMALKARFRPHDACLEITSRTDAHAPYEIDLLKILLHPTGRA